MYVPEILLLFTAAWEKNRDCSYIGKCERQKVLDPAEYHN
jgi:hypothetical protein